MDERGTGESASPVVIEQMVNEQTLAGLSLSELLMRRRGLRRQLAAKAGLHPVRIAVMSSSTPGELIHLLELWLLASGFAPTFYTPEFGRYYVDSVHDTQALVEFKPDIVYVHTSVLDVQGRVPMQATEEQFAALVKSEVARFEEIWQSVAEKLGCIILQNNFELPPVAMLGNLDGTLPGGRTRLAMELNREFAAASAKNPKLLLIDICSISARVGLDRWFDPRRWYSYKILTTAEANRALAMALHATIRAVYGKTRKVLVLDMDNTLWGGVIGDDGVDRIQIGNETPMAEAYTAFQQYCLGLRERGILLAVCSKNNEEIALQGLEHPESVLKREHFASFQANWDPKHENIARIARELNLGADSFVFVDDNPAERAIVAAQVNGIAVPEVGSDVTQYARIIEEGRYFEAISFSAEDLGRSALYAENSQRDAFEAKFADYGEYLDSLEMVAEIAPFKPVYLERIAQLTNKTNQFNLTTRRYTLAEMEQRANDPDCIALYGKLKDRFGDYGLISVVLGHRTGDALEIDLWLMSCRVLKRGMEAAMLDTLVEAAESRGITELRGTYLPTAKNAMVAEFYPSLGFQQEAKPSAELPEGATRWSLDLRRYSKQNQHIQRMEFSHV